MIRALLAEHAPTIAPFVNDDEDAVLIISGTRPDPPHRMTLPLDHAVRERAALGATRSVLDRRVDGCQGRSITAALRLV